MRYGSLLLLLIIVCHLDRFASFSCANHAQIVRTGTRLHANPVNADGSHYRGAVTEDEAFMWFDEASLYVRAGSGGAGSNTYRYGKSRQHLGPIGGSGGLGGSVIMEADSKLNTLLKFKGIANFRAENGMPGECNFLNGRYGSDFVIYVPPGTIIRDADTLRLIGELGKDKDRLTVAKGGLGGQGNGASKATRGGKAICTPPTGGERRSLKLELKLVADIGLVGVPNAGKSTLLDAITNARPKIAAYPFTTIVPNLGVCEVDRFHTETRDYADRGVVDGGVGPSVLHSGVAGHTMVIADIPGLLDGAHQGVGLGRAFLRHIERCKTIIHVVNGDTADPVRDYLAINNELQLYSPVLARKPQIVVLNKVDLPTVSERLPELTDRLREVMPHTRLLTISAAGRIGVADLVAKSWQFLQKLSDDSSSVSPVINR